ncbi:hypothetical protein F5148DRAFT_261551 [Russula earlei]|uniref:Uncharacterized protein n=1 Tax=Russula earlei TaxID=71964 RepID=A0ACC0UJ68_9AGAM|nr:hypothetical protein F5148DRAFT_261551 [Russula earlei]
MAPRPFTFALLVLLTASLVFAGPVSFDNATLLLNGQQALVLNCQFQSLQKNDPCITGQTACIQGESATCVNSTWQTLPCPSSKSCFALPQVRTNGTFIACTSPNNAASIIVATGIQTNIANNCTSLGDTPFPFSPFNNTTPGDGGNTDQGGNGQPNSGGQGVSSLSGLTTSTSATTTQPTLTLPPTTTTLAPEQASSLISILSANGQGFAPPVPSPSPGIVNNVGGNASGSPPFILLTSHPDLAPTPS